MEWEPRDLPENNVTDVHPLRELVVLLAGITAATVLLTGALALFIDVAVRYLPADWEAALFSDFWGEVEAVEDERQDRARELLGRLAEHWDENPYQLQLFVVDESEPNAFALPGGAIGVTQGLLDEVESENELAFVLAHELGHFQGRHHLRGVSRSLAVGLVLALATGGSSGTLVTQWVSNLTQLGFAREHELEADRFGLGIVVAEYGHTGGAADFFRRLPGNDVGGLHRMGKWLATHPVSPERISELERVARREGWRSRGALTPLYPEDEPR